MRKLTFTLALGVLALPVHADKLPLPADTPASYRSECGSCHLAYPPQLLQTGDWQQIMVGLDQHFGSDATVDARQRQEISRFLQRHGATRSKYQQVGMGVPRLSQTEHFRREHRDIPTALWRDARVKSAANCEACHRQAAEGRFSEHEMALPELQQRHGREGS